jgi:UDP-N-acetylglucosamine--N-acetylmuramyl-(pentapeptide) pyrophosphoryl-undecaprenol N-acetylglucosamine transferase
MKLLIFMCGEGLGHTSRCISLGRELLSHGHEVFFAAYGYSRILLEKSGYRVTEIPSEIKLVGESGSLDMKESIDATIKNAQILGGPKVLKMVSDAAPDVVVSDSYYLGVMAAKALGIPVYLTVNQTNMLDFFRNRGVGMRIIGELAKSFYMTVFENVDRVIIPDYPPPYTICRRNIVLTKEISERVVYTGPLTRRKYGEVETKELMKPHVLSMVGGFGYRKSIFDSVLRAAGMDDTISYTLVSGPNVDKHLMKDTPKNVEVLEFIENPFPYLKASDVVIVPGGHSSIMESLSFGVPPVSCPDMFHSEQENNATVINEEGLGRRLSYHSPPEVFLECIHEVIEDESFRRKTARLRRLSEKLNGPERYRKLLEDECK